MEEPRHEILFKTLIALPLHQCGLLAMYFLIVKSSSTLSRHFWASFFLCLWAFLMVFVRFHSQSVDTFNAAMYFILFCKSFEFGFLRTPHQIQKLHLTDVIVEFLLIRKDEVVKVESHKHDASPRDSAKEPGDRRGTSTPLRLLFSGLSCLFIGGFFKELVKWYDAADLSSCGWLQYYAVYACYGLSLCLLMEGEYNILLGATRLVMGDKFAHAFRYPLLATGPRDFWGRRWNQLFGRLFHRCVFEPSRSVMTRLFLAPAVPTELEPEHHARQSSPPPRPAIVSVDGRRIIVADIDSGHPKRKGDSARCVGRNAVAAVAGMLSFATSGLMHELLFWHSINDARGENLLFFLLHGALTSAQVCLHRAFPSLPHALPRWLSVLLWNALLVATLPLFFAPLIRSRALSVLLLPPSCSLVGLCSSNDPLSVRS